MPNDMQSTCYRFGSIARYSYPPSVVNSSECMSAPRLTKGMCLHQYLCVLLCWQAERDNKSVYFQHVPAADSLPAVQPRRLVSATAYTLPAPAALVNDTLMESFAEVPPDKVDILPLC